MTEYKTISIQDFDSKLKPFLTEVSGEGLGGKVLSTSDDFFVPKENLIKPYAARGDVRGTFGPYGALYDGWETRRHNPTFDWCIVLLATPTTHISYVDIDTAYFSGNECPESEVWGLQLTPEEIAKGKNVKISSEDSRWTMILPRITCKADSRHLFEVGKVGKEGVWSALKVHMIPDGGMARFRAYGNPLPPTPLTSFPDVTVPPINLLDPLIAARVVAGSDANFSPPTNLILPGRGTDMSDGWETRRSQIGRGKYAKGAPLEGKERCEWAVIRLAGTGVVSYVEIDTAFHPGNYPFACQVQAILSNEEHPGDDAGWVTLVKKTNTGPHRQHFFEPERAVSPTAVFSHVKLTIFPDGGLKRLRIWGHPVAADFKAPPPTDLTLRALPLTYETFKEYGNVVSGYSLNHSAPKGIRVNIANQGTAFKFHRLATFDSLASGLTIGTQRTQSQADTKSGARLQVTSLERRKESSAAFLPMSKDTVGGVEALTGGGAYVSVVALSGPDGKPDLKTAKAFLGTSAQGVVYNPGTWHYQVTIDGPLDYCTLEAKNGADIEKAPVTAPVSVYVAPYTAAPTSIKKAAKQVANGVLSGLKGLASALPSGGSGITPIPLTPESWAPYGSVISAHPSLNTKSVTTQGENGTVKYQNIGEVITTYPADAKAVTGVSLFRCTPKVGLERSTNFDVRFMERHPYTTQAFVPLGKAEIAGQSEDALPVGGQMYVVAADNGPDDRPDPKTLKVFVMSSSTGVQYNAGVWHHPCLVVDQALDLACIETQVSTGVPEPDARDCELIEYSEEEPFGSFVVPAAA